MLNNVFMQQNSIEIRFLLFHTLTLKQETITDTKLVTLQCVDMRVSSHQTHCYKKVESITMKYLNLCPDTKIIPQSGCHLPKFLF